MQKTIALSSDTKKRFDQVRMDLITNTQKIQNQDQVMNEILDIYEKHSGDKKIAG